MILGKIYFTYLLYLLTYINMYFENENHIYLAKQYGCFTASLEFRILSGWHLQNEKVSQAQILSGS